MPRIPTYEQKELPTTEVGAVKVSPSEFGQEGERMQDVGKLLFTVGQKFQELTDFNQKNKAWIDLSGRLDKYHNDTMASDDVWSASQRAPEDIMNIGNEVAQSITNPQARNEFMDSFQRVEYPKALNQINTVVNRRKLNESAYNYMEKMGKNVNKLASASPQEESIIKNEMRLDTMEAIRMGITTGKAGYNYLNSMYRKAGVEAPEYDMGPNGENSAMVMEELQKGENGAYPDIDMEDRQKLIKRADSMGKRNQKIQDYTAKKQVAQNETMFMDRSFNGTLKPKDVEEAMLTGAISTPFAEKMMKKIGGPDSIEATTDSATWDNLMDTMTHPEASPQQIRDKLLDANANGKLSNVDFKRLYSMAVIPTEAGKPESLSQLMGVQNIEAMQEADDKSREVHQEKKWYTRSIWDYFSNRTSDDDQRRKLQSDFINVATQRKVSNDKLQEVADEVTMKNFVTKHPDIVSAPKEGRTGYDKNGRPFKYYPPDKEHPYGRIIKQ